MAASRSPIRPRLIPTAVAVVISEPVGDLIGLPTTNTIDIGWDGTAARTPHPRIAGKLGGDPPNPRVDRLRDWVYGGEDFLKRILSMVCETGFEAAYSSVGRSCRVRPFAAKS